MRKKQPKFRKTVPLFPLPLSLGGAPTLTTECPAYQNPPLSKVPLLPEGQQRLQPQVTLLRPSDSNVALLHQLHPPPSATIGISGVAPCFLNVVFFCTFLGSWQRIIGNSFYRTCNHHPAQTVIDQATIESGTGRANIKPSQCGCTLNTLQRSAV